MNILCLLLPHFPLMCEVLRNPAVKGQSMLITHGSSSQKLVLDYSPSLDSLQCDMPIQQALALHGEVELITADIPYYRIVFNQLLDALEKVSPLVEGAEPGCAYIGVDGLQLIYPDDDAIIGAVREIVPLPFNPQIGIAGNKFLACLAARKCRHGGQLILNGDVTAFLRDLPCDLLPVSRRSREKLHSFGLHTLGQVAALPPGPIKSQFGPEGKTIWELAKGRDDTPLYPRGMEEVIEESTTLVSVSVAMEAILIVVTSLLSRIFDRIAVTGKGISSMSLWTRGWDEGRWERSIRFKEPAMDVSKSAARIKRVMEDYPQPGPVEQVGIRVDRLAYPRGKQSSLFSEIRAKDHLREDIRQLELRLGNPQVYWVKEVEPWSRIPERRYTLMPSSR